MTLSKYIKTKTNRFHDDYVIENIKEAHRNFLDNPKIRPSLYDSKARNMPNTARYMQKTFEGSPNRGSSNGSRKYSPENNSDTDPGCLDLT